MARRKTQLFLVGLVCSVTAVAAACNKNDSTAPSPILTTDTFSGTINPGSVSSHAFNVNYSYAYTDANFTISSLTSASSGNPVSITLGVGFGTYSVGVCTRVAGVTNPTAPISQKLPTNTQPFGPGTYCIQVFDNPDAPTVTEPLKYTLVVEHY
ncbi:MAG: hypothetical protein IT184_14795 [Acidobacteria bacterium]|nr:hypothetical protein [Acidobacteriota bacterium]